MAEQISLSEGLPDQPEFTNEDGTPATWTEQLSKYARRKAFALPFSVSLVIALSVWAMQSSNGVLGRLYPVGLVIVAVGAALGINAHRKTSIRRFASHKVLVPQRRRLYRGFIWALLSTTAVALVSLLAFPLGDAELTFWWNAVCGAIVVVPAIGFSMLKREIVLTPRAAGASLYYGQLAKQSKWKKVAVVDTLLDTLLLWALRTGLVVLVMVVGWALFAGVAALPVSVAVIIGALIIAAALHR